MQDECGNKLDSELGKLKGVAVDVFTGPIDEDSAPAVIHDLQAAFQVLTLCYTPRLWT